MSSSQAIPSEQQQSVANPVTPSTQEGTLLEKVDAASVPPPLEVTQTKGGAEIAVDKQYRNEETLQQFTTESPPIEEVSTVKPHSERESPPIQQETTPASTEEMTPRSIPEIEQQSLSAQASPSQTEIMKGPVKEPELSARGSEIIREAPYVESVQEKFFVEKRSVTNIHEVHEQPIYEVHQKPVIRTYEEPPEVREYKNSEVIYEEANKPEPFQSPQRPNMIERKRETYIANVTAAPIIKERIRKEVLKIVEQPIITEIHHKPIVEIYEQPVVRTIYEKPIIRTVREPEISENINIQHQAIFSPQSTSTTPSAIQPKPKELEPLKEPKEKQTMIEKPGTMQQGSERYGVVQ